MNRNNGFVWNIPNVLSLYRILCFPVCLYFIWIANKDVFTILICISLVTDVLDGYIARKFNMATPLGAKLDSVADIFTYICAVCGVYRFEYSFITGHPFSIGLFFVLYVLGFLIGFIKFGKLVSLHNYSFKITAYVQGIFFFVLFAFGYYDWVYYPAICVGTWACTEDILVLLVLKEPRSNVKGLYWVLMDNKNL